MEHFAIAIDGPAASGKSTIARRLAERLGLVMVNSGAMYRAVTWQVLLHGIDPHDSAAVVDLLGRLEISCGDDGVNSTLAIGGVESGDALRCPEVNAAVSVVAAIPEVRARLVGFQRDYLKRVSVVMEGRDIGSVVFPDTPYKIYVTASEEVRAARRKDMGEVDSVASRDAADSGRATAPLMVAEGAAVLDNSVLGVEETVQAALDILCRQGLRNEPFPMCARQ